MSLRTFGSTSIAAIAGVSMLALCSMSPASAFTLSGPSLAQPVASAQIDQVWWRGGWGGRGWGGHGWGWRGGWGGWRGGWGWRGPGWGWRGGWGVGHCWRGYWGRVHCY